MIVQSINEHQFIDMFINSSREDQFTIPALRLIYNHLSDMSDEMNEHIIVEIITICCEYEEYSIVDYYEENQEEINNHYMTASYDDLSIDEIIDYAMLHDNLASYDDNILILYS